MYNVTYTRKSLKFLEKLSKTDKNLSNKVIDAIEYISKDPSNFKKLRGRFKGLNRIQIGKIRVVFKIYKKELIILVVDIGKRNKIYR